jgi:hypothetical protein
MPVAAARAQRLHRAIASPELAPGAGSPWMVTVGKPLKRSSFGAP